MVHASSGMCTGGMNTVTKILTRYDQCTGEPEKLICLGDHWFTAKDGLPYTPPWAYHINLKDLG